jgi:T4 bacteriophage base plate protein
MALPKIDIPTQNIVLPSTKKELLVRPFLVKEEKILLTALQSGETKDVVHATKQVVQNCVLVKDFDVDKLPMYDLEFLILQLRIMSIGNTITIRVQPREKAKCDACKKGKEIEVDITSAKVVFDDKHKNKVELTDKVGLILRDPDAKLMESFEKTSESTDLGDLFRLIWACVESVYDDTSVTSSKDVSEKEGIEFLESLNATQFNKIDEFFRTLPKLSLPVEVKCDKCGFEETHVLEKLESFFG